MVFPLKVLYGCWCVEGKIRKWLEEPKADCLYCCGAVERRISVGGFTKGARLAGSLLGGRRKDCDGKPLD